MSALRREGDHVLVVLHDPGGGLFVHHAPAVDARAVKHDFLGLAGLQLRQVRGGNEVGLLLRAAA